MSSSRVHNAPSTTISVMTVPDGSSSNTSDWTLDADTSSAVLTASSNANPPTTRLDVKTSASSFTGAAQ